MKHYIFDGNNLMHKIAALQKILQKDKQTPREKLAFMIEDYFRGKRVKLSLHFDGFENLPIKTERTKIIYSDKKSADENIRAEIETERNRKNLSVVTSDDALREFARKCGCEVISSEEFNNLIKNKNQNVEENKIKELKNDIEYFKKLFR